MNLDLGQLRTFHVLAQQKSFTRAAGKLFVTQSAVSHAIRKLEASAGGKLFERHGAELSLTETGAALYASCETVFAELERAEEAIRLGRDVSPGTIRLGSTVEFGATVLVRCLAPFLREHPDIAVDLQLKHEPLPLLLDGELDVVVDCRNAMDPSLAKIPLFREQFIVAASPAYLEAHPVRDVADLGACLVLSMDKQASWWRNFLRALPAGGGPEFGRVMAVNHIRGMINAAVESIGVALLPRYCIRKELERGSLVSVFPDIRLEEDRFYIYVKKNRASYRRHQLLVEHLRGLQPVEFGA